MRRRLFQVAAVVSILLFSSLAAQDLKKATRGREPTSSECVAKAKRAADPRWLSQRTSSEINELDWELSVCEGKFLPLKPEGAMLIAEGHGMVADEFRRRIEKAIGTLPSELQKKVWDAFNSDTGGDATK